MDEAAEPVATADLASRLPVTVHAGRFAFTSIILTAAAREIVFDAEAVGAESRLPIGPRNQDAED